MCSCTAKRLRGLKQSAAQHERHRLRLDFVSRFRLALAPLMEREIEEAAEALDRLDTWLRSFYPEQEARVRQAVEPTVQEYADQTVALMLEEVEADVTPVALSTFATQFTAGLGARWTNDSIAQIRQILRDEEEPEEAMRERLGQWEEGRDQRTAEAEATQGAGAFARYGMIVAGVSTMVWRTIGQNCPLCAAMEGKRVLVSGSFMEPGDTLEGAGEEQLRMTAPRRISHPPLHGQGKRGGVCDCIVGAAA